MIAASHRALLILLLPLTALAYLPLSATALPIDHLLRVMASRLALQHDVARWKWHAKRPIEDRARENALLERMERRAVQRGLDPARVRAVFTAQIEVGKRLQRADFTAWHLQGAPAPGPDLALLRWRLDRVSEELVDALAQAEPWLSALKDKDSLEIRARSQLRVPGVNDALRREVLQPLTENR
jgi:chorismate mutase